MTAIRVEPDEGPPVTFMPGGSRITDEESVTDLLELTIQRVRAANRPVAARPKSYAITKLQDALLWLVAFERGEIR